MDLRNYSAYGSC